MANGKNGIEMVHAGSLSLRDTVVSIAIIACLFFIFGFTTWINAILIPYFKIACELNTTQSLLVAFAFYIAYFVMAIPAAHLLQRVGFKVGIMIGFWVMAAGALIFIPAALARTFGSILHRHGTCHPAARRQHVYYHDRVERESGATDEHHGRLQ